MTQADNTKNTRRSLDAWRRKIAAVNPTIPVHENQATPTTIGPLVDHGQATG